MHALVYQNSQSVAKNIHLTLVKSYNNICNQHFKRRFYHHHPELLDENHTCTKTENYMIVQLWYTKTIHPLPL
jgi:hypothetical protein